MDSTYFKTCDLHKACNLSLDPVNDKTNKRLGNFINQFPSTLAVKKNRTNWNSHFEILHWLTLCVIIRENHKMGKTGVPNNHSTHIRLRHHYIQRLRNLTPHLLSHHYSSDCLFSEGEETQ